MTLRTVKLDSDQMAAIEEILYRESGVIDPDDVDLLMAVFARELADISEEEYFVKLEATRDRAE